MKNYKIAIIGLAHSHAGLLYKYFLPHAENMTVLGFADYGPFDRQTPEERRTNMWLKEGEPAPTEYKDYKELLALKPDIVVVTAENCRCTEVALEAMEQGAVVVLEKPMCPTLAEARALKECAERNNTHVFTNWPICWMPAFTKARELAQSGKIGKIQRVVYRSPATMGPYGINEPVEHKARTWWYSKEQGGGSFLDYACYGTMLATWIFGKPAKRVSAITKQFNVASFSDVEDYSAMMLDFGDGVGLLEGSWSSFNPGEIPSGPIIYGEKGVIVTHRYSDLVKVYTTWSHGYTEPDEVYDTSDMPKTHRFGENVMAFLEGKGELEEMLGVDVNLAVAAALDAGRRSADEGTWVETGL